MRKETAEKLVNDCIRELKAEFDNIADIALHNQEKVLDAFRKNAVQARHFAGSTGYGYDDAGRDTLSQVFADALGAESAVVSPMITAGTQALTLMLFGVLRPGDLFVSVTGKPYDTLSDVISGENCGSLKEFGVDFDMIGLKEDGLTPVFDFDSIEKMLTTRKVKAVFAGRSRGYEWRSAVSVEQIGEMIAFVKRLSPETLVLVDNCYGEFVEKIEPTDVGADLIAGSLIKNIGGGIAPTGGYIAGRADLVEKCGHRLTAPGTGRELGCTLDTLRQLYLGLYYAPGVTAEALKSSIYASCLLELLGRTATPRYNEPRNDIITSLDTGSAEALVAFCQGIQAGSPVDSFVAPEPYAMPGYESPVVMAAGAFTLGSSIELSCDGPLREPYTAYLQGGLNFTATRAGILVAVQRAFHL